MVASHHVFEVVTENLQEVLVGSQNGSIQIELNDGLNAVKRIALGFQTLQLLHCACGSTHGLPRVKLLRSFYRHKIGNL